MENSFVKSQNRFISRTLLTMSLGLLVTFITAMAFSIVMPEPPMALFLVAFIGELVLVISLSRKIQKLSVNTARAWFFVYSILNGITLSTIFTIYGFQSASRAFLFAALMFFSSSMIGMKTEKDLSTLQRVLFMALIGLLIITVFQMIWPMEQMSLFISFLGIIIFCGLTAFDMQRVKYIHQRAYEFDEVYVSKLSVLSALNLYLDFINIFLYVLELFRNN
ncbi:Bax inhibitor-1/YccA family protein [Clostridium sp. 19966]|uniref:Bax inhibitor-1/YccA family protein n=1 Tax=Clostridium sp. 19966 TaxID=2768166 RepID=UPI0028DFA438|nr:Bax inhibitor-1/YccA family protein [Clostridium sp. 19966]MDT8716287.1 Bax inhibitor-1/YccA family protein [Clostridium sp. 19966]